jgi:hypothetical protein
MGRIFAVASGFLIVAPAWPCISRADFIYSGMATGAIPTVEVTFLLGTTGPLPSDGGTRDVYLPNSNFSSLLSTGPISGVALGTAGLATANVTVNDLVLTFGGSTIAAQMLGGHATADGHTGGLPEVGGFSDFLGLTLNGAPVSVTGVPNQEIDLPNHIKLILNEQIISLDDTRGTITLNALHLYVNPVVDFRIASAQAGITANPNTSPTPEPGTLGLLAVALVSLLLALSIIPGAWSPTRRRGALAGASGSETGNKTSIDFSPRGTS